MQPPTLKLRIIAESGKAFAPFLRSQMARAWKISHRMEISSSSTPALRELAVILVDNRRMSRLHDQFMGLPGPTDVLSFATDLDRRGQPISGEIYVCVPEASQQAKARKLPLRLELLLYAIHGMLHLLGRDDRTERDFLDMHRMEDAILSELGFGPVFARNSVEAP